MVCAGLSGGAALSWTMELKEVYFNFLTTWWEGHGGFTGLPKVCSAGRTAFGLPVKPRL